MNIIINQLQIYLPHLQQELATEDFNAQLHCLTTALSQSCVSVACIHTMPGKGSGSDEWERTITLDAVKSQHDDHTVILTDDAGLAEFCAERQLPCCIVLDSGSRAAALPDGAYCIESLSDIDAQYLDRVYRRAKGIPWDIVETDRLLIREITLEDVPRLYELYSDDSITKYMDNLYPDPEQELSYTRDYIRNIYGFYSYGMWIITLKDTGEVIGRAGLEYKEGYEGLELGFMLGVKYQHQGYAYEACSVILEYGREWLGTAAYRAIVHKDNAPSGHLCERLGFCLNETAADTEEGYVEYQILG